MDTRVCSVLRALLPFSSRSSRNQDAVSAFKSLTQRSKKSKDLVLPKLKDVNGSRRKSTEDVNMAYF